MNVSHHLRWVALPMVLLSWALSTSAQKLDVKPGLWEITMADPKSVQQVCYTAKTLSSGFSQISMPPGMQCKNELLPSTARSVVTRTVCTGDFAVEGETRVDVVSPEAMTMQSTSVMNLGGNKQTIRASATYRWLRADCGNVKPFDPKKPFE